MVEEKKLDTEKLLDQVAQSVILLYANCEKEAFQEVQNLIEPVNEKMLALLQGFQGMQTDTLNEQKWIIGIMKKMIEAYEVCDTILLADILKYEVAECLKIYQEIEGHGNNE